MKMKIATLLKVTIYQLEKANTLWIPCWERASHLAHHACFLHVCFNIFVTFCAVLNFPPGVWHYENLPMQYTETFRL